VGLELKSAKCVAVNYASSSHKPKNSHGNEAKIWWPKQTKSGNPVVNFFNKYYEVSLNIRKTLEVNEVLMNYSRMHKLGL